MAHKRASRPEEKAPHRNAEGQPNEGQHLEGHEGEGQPAGGQQPDAMQRAEEMVDWLGQRVGHYTSVAGYYLLRAASRAREEAEDIWAEAQTIRRGRQQP
jgi:hypothetical protein